MCCIYTEAIDRLTITVVAMMSGCQSLIYTLNTISIDNMFCFIARSVHDVMFNLDPDIPRLGPYQSPLSVV